MNKIFCRVELDRTTSFYVKHRVYYPSLRCLLSALLLIIDKNIRHTTS